MHPDDRFQSAVEMADQLYGVLCHVVAELTGLPHPRPSTMFEAPGVSTVYLPELASDGSDSARHMLVSFPTVAASTADAERLIVELAIAAGIRCSMGVRLRRLRYGIDAWAGNPEKLEGELREVEDIDPWEWRVDWLRALDAVRRGDYDRALTAFERARSEAPGELAPMAAIGGVLELAGRYDEAGEMYQAVVDVDPGFVYAVFGLANCYEQVEAVVRAAELLAINGLAQDCADQLASVRPAPVIAAKLHVLSYLGALEALAAATPVSLRRGLKAAYRQLARLTVDSVDKLWLVDCANQARPWTIA